MAAWYEPTAPNIKPKDHTTMARVPYLQQSDLPPEHQDILARPIALNRAMANSPNAAKAMTWACDVHPPS
jgi:hypothetical protein